MKIKNFDYVKANGEEKKPELLIIHENKDLVEGIDLTKLSEDEQKSVKMIRYAYESRMKTFMKAYRRYTKSNITKVTGESNDPVE